MEINSITAVYFSATDTTKKVCEYIMNQLNENLKLNSKVINFTKKRDTKQYI